MMVRTGITLDPETHKRARERAARLGVSFAEYVRGLLARDLGEQPRSVDASVVFDLGRSQGSDVSRQKDRMLGKAAANESLAERPDRG